MIFSGLENTELVKRTNLSVGSSGFISLNLLKTFFPSSSVSDVLMVKNQENSSYSLSTDVLNDSSGVLTDLTEGITDSSEILDDLTEDLNDLDSDLIN